jgi:hypothetical protein
MDVRRERSANMHGVIRCRYQSVSEFYLHEIQCDISSVFEATSGVASRKPVHGMRIGPGMLAVRKGREEINLLLHVYTLL